jgi:hypothetical protein
VLNVRLATPFFIYSLNQSSPNKFHLIGISDNLRQFLCGSAMEFPSVSFGFSIYPFFLRP